MQKRRKEEQIKQKALEMVESIKATWVNLYMRLLSKKFKMLCRRGN